MTCTSCGSDVSGKKFCPQCGTPVQPAVSAAVMTACPRCGGEVKAGAAFCMHCGSALQAAQPVAAVQPTTRPCPTCHQAVPFENAFCIHCGQNMNAPVAAAQPVAPASVICSNCGKQNTSDMRFCGGCGSPLAAQQGQLPQQQPYGQPQYPQQYGQQQYPQQPQYNQPQYPQQYGQYNQQGYQQQPMMGQQPMTLRCPVCMAMSPLGTPSCPGCRTSLVGVVPTPANMAPQGQQGMMGGGIGNFLQGNNGKMAMGALGGAAAVLGGEMLLHGVENSMGGGDRDYEGYEHHHHRREEEGPLGGLGDIANDIGLF